LGVVGRRLRTYSELRYVEYSAHDTWDGRVGYHVVQKIKEQVHRARREAVLV
jgi:hypothetical protein